MPDPAAPGHTCQPGGGLARPPEKHPRLRRAAAVVAAGAAVVAVAVAGMLAVPSPHPTAPGPPLKPCGTRSPVPCYGQDPLHRSYRMGALYQRGITGDGTTIAVIAAYRNPWTRRDLAAYSRWFRLPTPHVQVITAGRVPEAAPGNREAAAWGQEVTADLEVAHFMAPAAQLIYLAIPPSDQETTAMAALAWLVTHTHVDVVSFSWGTYEPQISQSRNRQRYLARLRTGLVAAARAHVTVVAGSDDSGPTVPTAGGRLARYRAVAWPTTDPLVTAVGSAVLHTRPDGTRLRPDTVAGDDGRGHATGAGLSVLYPRPAWQDRVAAVTGSHRGVADISMALSAWVYTHLGSGRPGWGVLKGTSISAPLFAGLVADAAQLAGRSLGVLGPALYGMRGSRDGVLDITQGSNTLGGVTGYTARPGYDLPSGIGTVGSAWPFVTALAHVLKASQHSHGHQTTAIDTNAREAR